MTNEIGVFTPHDARLIRQKVLSGDMFSGKQYGIGDRNSLRWHYVKLLEDLPSATSPLTGYTQARASVLMYIEGIDTLNMEVITGTENEITITNRSVANSASADDYILVRHIIKEWAPVWGGGGGGGETIWFTVDEGPVCDPYLVSDPYILVTAAYYTGGCSKIPPGAEYDGKYRVYDYCNYFGCANSMGGTRGRATYMWPLSGTCVGKWIMDDTCYEPECV